MSRGALTSVAIRPMREADLVEADRVYRRAFGTQFGLPDPSRFRGDAQVLRVRWTADSRPCFVAENDGRIVGSVIGMDWGSVFVLGPLTVDPAHADRGIGRRLMAPAMDFVAARGFALAALFTFPASPKHIHLYESYGFVPQRLTPVLSKATANPAVVPANAGTQSTAASLTLDSRLRGNDETDEATRLYSDLAPPSRRPLFAIGPSSMGEGQGRGDSLGCALFSQLSLADRAAALAACRAVSDAIFPGLDLTREIEAIRSQRLGETVLLREGGTISGFALCHIGAGSEAGSGGLFVKFACVQPGDADGFARLVEACEALAAARGAARVVAGVNRGRDGAYRLLRERGFRADLIGVAMHRPDSPGYNRPEIYAIDDWR